MSHYVLDTNIVSLILRENPGVIQNFEVRSPPDNIFLGCPIVYYEIRRGMLAKSARQQLGRFENLFALFKWQDYTREDWELAGVLWALRRSIGRQISDADLLIGVFARNRQAILVTDNEKDFERLDVALENWKK